MVMATNMTDMTIRTRRRRKVGTVIKAGTGSSNIMIRDMLTRIVTRRRKTQRSRKRTSR